MECHHTITGEVVCKMAMGIRKAVADPAERRAILASLRGSLKGDGLDPIAGLEAEHRREIEADEREQRMRGL